MIATLINVATIVIGTIIGLFFRKGLPERAKELVFVSTGIISLIIGFSMALTSTHIVALALSLILGGLLGNAIGIEDAVFKLGQVLGRRFGSKEERNAQVDQADPANPGAVQSAQTSKPSFAFGFLNASVLFCVGAMALVGSFKAGAEQDYSLLLTKSVMDGFIAIMFTGAMGVGVGFSALPVFLYQGTLTLLASRLAHLVSDTLLTELSAVGGALVIMIGINLLNLKKIRTGDFLPALVVMLLLTLLFPYVPFL